MISSVQSRGSPCRNRIRIVRCMARPAPCPASTRGGQRIPWSRLLAWPGWSSKSRTWHGPNRSWSTSASRSPTAWRRRCNCGGRVREPDQGDWIMSINLDRAADGWWLLTSADLVPLDLPATTTNDVLAERSALDGAILEAGAAPRRAVPAQSLDLFSPMTAVAAVGLTQGVVPWRSDPQPPVHQLRQPGQVGRRPMRTDCDAHQRGAPTRTCSRRAARRGSYVCRLSATRPQRGQAGRLGIADLHLTAAGAGLRALIEDSHRPSSSVSTRSSPR